MVWIKDPRYLWNLKPKNDTSFFDMSVTNVFSGDNSNLRFFFNHSEIWSFICDVCSRLALVSKSQSSAYPV
jgi:hypothetical protein